MKRSITRWTTTLATAAVLGLPAVGAAQSSSTTPPRESPQPPTQQPSPEPPSRRDPVRPSPEPPTQPTPQPAAEPPMTQPPAGPSPATEPTSPEPRGSAATAPSTTPDASPEEHLRQARAALDAVPAASLTGRARTQVTELKRHMAALNRGSAAATPAPAGTATAPGKASANASANWGTEVAAMDKLLGELLGSGTGASPSATPGATGTAGTAGASGATGTSDTLDETTRARLTEVRTHITAYAASRAAASSTAPKGADAGSTASPIPAGAATAPAQSTAAAAAPANGATTAQSSAPTQAPSGEAGAQPSEGQGDAEAARQALTTARDTLSQLTQLPAAAQLSGEARTQVAQLISNFNELITTQVQWRASYGKVAANLAALIGPEATDNSAGANAAPSAATGTPESSTSGAVGTSGSTTVQVDPAIRAKLIELRRNLSDFEEASGGTAK